MTTQPEDEEEVFTPSPVLVDGTVRIGHSLDVHDRAADFGSHQTYATPAGADIARPILPYDIHRHRAILTVSAPAAPVAGSGVWVGTQAQCQASPPVGGFLPVGTSAYVIENCQPLWLVGDGTNALRVTVLAERWEGHR